MIVVLVFGIPAVAGAVALFYSASWVWRRDSRDEAARRYPLRTLTWLLALPPAFALLMAVFVGVIFAPSISIQEDLGGSEFDEVIARLIVPVVGLIGTAIAIAVIVLSHHVASPHRKVRPWWILILSALPILAVLYVALWFMLDWKWSMAAALVLGLGSLANALMAVPVASARRDPASPPPPVAPPPPPSL